MSAGAAAATVSTIDAARPRAVKSIANGALNGTAISTTRDTAQIRVIT